MHVSVARLSTAGAGSPTFHGDVATLERRRRLAGLSQMTIREPVQTVAVETPRSRRVRVTDTVCGMELDPEGDAVRRTIDGTQWRFCSDACAAVHTTLPSPGRVDGQG